MSTDSPAENLCTACGLCCSGALFDYGPLEKDEVSRVREAGLNVLEAEGKFGFGLPCPALEGAFCTAYEARPQTCRSYKCMTLRALEEGEIDHDTAMGHVHEAQEMLAQVQVNLPEGATIVIARRWRRKSGSSDASPELLASPNLMIALGMLDLVLDQHFRKPEQRQVMPREDA